MLTIASVAVLPVPAQGSVAARVPAITPARASDNVSVRNQGVTTPVVPTGTGAALVQGTNAPPALPPVNPSETVLRAQNFDNAAAPERFQFSTTERVAAQVLGERAGSPAAPLGTAAQAASSTAVAPAANPSLNTAAGLAVSASGAPASVAAALGDAQAAPAALGQQRVPGQVAADPALQMAQPPVPAQQAEPLGPAQQAQQLQPGAVAQEQQRQRAAAVNAPPNPAQEALAERLRDLLPNAWSASRFAVDQLIGEEARQAQAARADLLAPLPPSPLERALEAAAENYQRTSSLPEPPNVGVQVDRLI